MRLFLATGNAHKVEEMRALLSGVEGVAVLGADAAAAGGMPVVEETADDFHGNARLKAAALRARVGPADWVVADDSGLVVDALDGRPGVRSARYAGPGADDRANLEKVLRELERVDDPRRTAAFVCCLVLLGPEGAEQAFEGRCPGRLIREPRGAHGFGYDPIFVPDGHEHTFAELGAEVKDRISHRARAAAGLRAYVLSAARAG